MQENKLTPTEIAAKSEVIAKYMGGQIKIYSCGENEVYFNHRPANGIYNQFKISKLKYHSSWDCLHEVWERLREEATILLSEHDFRLRARLINNITHSMCYGTPEQCFIALFEAVTFINSLKQSNNAD